MDKNNLKDIENSIKAHIEIIKKASDTSEMEELLRINHRPGWINPAESFLVKNTLNSMNEHCRILYDLKQFLLNSSRLVGKKIDDKLMNVVKISNKRVNEKENRMAKDIVSSDIATQLIGGFPPLPELDLTYRGGKTISDLSYANFYIGKSDSWDQSDIKSIDSVLGSAMSGKNLNNVIVQHFPDTDKITSSFKGSELFPGDYLQRFFKDDVENLFLELCSQKKLDNYDLENTVFNFILSP
jgi:hypothetical protein